MNVTAHVAGESRQLKIVSRNTKIVGETKEKYYIDV